MPSTPISGQISFSDVKSLTTDKLGYTPPVNVSIGTLASVVRQFGQKAPGANNIAFSNFYLSTIAGYNIITTSSTVTVKWGFRWHWSTYRFDITRAGTITVYFKSNTFKKNNNGTYFVKVEFKVQNPSMDYKIVANISKTINWNNPDNQNFVSYTDVDLRKSLDQSSPLAGLPATQKYIVTVSDLTTGSVIGTTNVDVSVNGPGKSYYVNS